MNEENSVTFNLPCMNCGYPVTFVQEESWSTPIGYCNNCKNHYYAVYDFITGRIKIFKFDIEEDGGNM